MADFEYVGNGTLTMAGEGDYAFVPLEHVVGDVVYIKYKITKYLQLERVAIKKIIINDATVVYIDTLNRAWLDGELLKENEAMELIYN